MCVVCGFVHKSAKEATRGLDALELYLQTVASCSTWVLRAKFTASARVVYALSHSELSFQSLKKQSFLFRLVFGHVCEGLSSLIIEVEGPSLL